MCEHLTQWATILSPVVAVILAWFTSRSGARDTAKLIKCSKKMMQINLRIKLLELSKEAKMEHVDFEHLFKKSKELSNQYWTESHEWSKDDFKQHEANESDVNDRKDYTFDKRMVIGETMEELLTLIREIDKL